MTTIAYRDGAMAADTRAEQPDHVTYGCCKLLREHDGTLWGFAGVSAAYYAMRRQILELKLGGPSSRYLAGYVERLEQLSPIEEDENHDTKLAVLVAFPTGAPFTLTSKGWWQCSGPYQAIGLDAAIAIGAMHAGADVEGAVRAAIAHGLHTGGEVQTIRRSG